MHAITKLSNHIFKITLIKGYFGNQLMAKKLFKQTSNWLSSVDLTLVTKHQWKFLPSPKIISHVSPFFSFPVSSKFICLRPILKSLYFFPAINSVQQSWLFLIYNLLHLFYMLLFLIFNLLRLFFMLLFFKLVFVLVIFHQHSWLFLIFKLVHLCFRRAARIDKIFFISINTILCFFWNFSVFYVVEHFVVCIHCHFFWTFCFLYLLDVEHFWTFMLLNISEHFGL